MVVPYQGPVCPGSVSALIPAAGITMATSTGGGAVASAAFPAPSWSASCALKAWTAIKPNSSSADAIPAASWVRRPLRPCRRADSASCCWPVTCSDINFDSSVAWVRASGMCHGTSVRQSLRQGLRPPEQPVHGGDEDEGREGGKDHPADHGPGQRRVLLAALADA